MPIRDITEIIRLSQAGTHLGLKINNTRRWLVHTLKGLVVPKLRDSSYTDADDAKWLHIVLFSAKHNASGPRVRTLKNSHGLRDGFVGFYEDGVILDAGMEISTTTYKSLPVEDLLRLLRLVLRLKPADFY